MHFADDVIEATAMKNQIYQQINISAPRDSRPLISRRLVHEPIAFGAFKYVHIAPCANRSISMQAARGDDELMSMDPNLTQA